MQKPPRRAPRGGCFVAGRFYRGGCFIPANGEVIPATTPSVSQQAHIPRAGNGTLVDALANQLIHIAEAELPLDHDYSKSMNRVLRGRAWPKDYRRLKIRRIEAIALLRDRAMDLLAREYWHELYVAEVAGVAV